MKRLFYFGNIILLLTVLFGCSSKNESYPTATGQPIPTFDKEILITLEEETETLPVATEKNTVPSQEISENREGFLIKHKKYRYNNSDVIIMDITNQTTTDYSITVEGTFYDKDGNILKTSRKNFQGWAAGYHNFFLFQPSINFESFEYVLKTQKYDGECLAKYLEISGFKCLNKSYRKVGINGDYVQTGYVTVEACYPLKNSYDQELHYSAIYVVFDNQGEIYTIDSRLLQDGLYPGEYPDYGRIILQSDVLWPDREKYELPEKLRGEVNGLMIIRKVSDTPLA